MRFVLVLLLAMVGATWADVEAPEPNITTLRNFAHVSDILDRGAQPERRGFETLRAMGVKTIVNLRYWHNDVPLIHGLGFRYVWLRTNAFHPEPEDVARFLKIVEDPDNAPIFVHCEHGADRTGLMVESYRMLDQSLPLDQALQELANFHHDPHFGGIDHYLRHFDPTQLRQTIDALPPQRPPVIK